MDDLFVRLSEPLKKMQAEYLTSVAKNCYKERHLSENFTNYEQILQCKETERTKIWGTFDKMYSSPRDSGRFRFQDCMWEANNNVEKAVYCVRDYVKQIKQDNDTMADLFKKEYSKYSWSRLEMWSNLRI